MASVIGDSGSHKLKTHELPAGRIMSESLEDVFDNT